MRRIGLLLLFVLASAACTNEYSLAMAADSPTPPIGDDAARVVPDDLELTNGRRATTTSPITSTSTTVPPEPITLGFVGDVQMIGSMAEQQPLVAVTGLLSAPDLTLANLETVVGDAAELGSPPIDKEFIFRSPPETLDQLVAAGVDVVALANNHSWDYGPLGTRVTRERVDASPLIGVGAGVEPDVAYAPAFVEVGGYTVGLVSLTRVPCDWSRDQEAERPEVAWACDRYAIAALGSIAQAEAGSDLTVVMLHGGTEVTDCPDEALRAVIDTWIEMGVDAISISHPHVLQGAEIVSGTPVLWSTGNFAFRNNGGRTGRSAVFEVTLGGETPEVRAHPTVLPRGIAAPADADVAATVFAEINDRSVGGAFGADGVLVENAEPSRCD